MLRQWGTIIEKHPWFVVITILIITIGFSTLLPNIQFKTDFSDFSPEDELVRANRMARNLLLDIEAQSDEELDRLINEFRIMNIKYQKALEKRVLKHLKLDSIEKENLSKN